MVKINMTLRGYFNCGRKTRKNTAVERDTTPFSSCNMMTRIKKTFECRPFQKVFKALHKEFIQRFKWGGGQQRNFEEGKPPSLERRKEIYPIVHAASHVGKIRQRNEDRYIVREFPEGGLLLAVADGMGGHVRGDLAAKTMVEKLASMTLVSNGVLNRLISTVSGVDKLLVKMAERDMELEGMGTTVTACIISGETGYWVHVGDSRLYLLRGGVIRQITVDQTMVQFLISEGEITVQDGRTHPGRHHLEQCVGCGDCEPVVGRFAISPGDHLLFSTDGLHDTLSSETIMALLGSDCHVREKANALIQEALGSDGNDNITVVVAQF